MSINPSDALNFPRAGDLNQRVTIVRPQRTRNDSGGAETEWVTVAKAWANIRPLNPREVEAASAISARLTYEVTIRYRKHITPQMHVWFRGADLLIHGVVNQGTLDRALILHCEDVTVRQGA